MKRQAVWFETRCAANRIFQSGRGSRRVFFRTGRAPAEFGRRGMSAGARYFHKHETEEKDAYGGNAILGADFFFFVSWCYSFYMITLRRYL